MPVHYFLHHSLPCHMNLQCAMEEVMDCRAGFQAMPEDFEQAKAPLLGFDNCEMEITIVA